MKTLSYAAFTVTVCQATLFTPDHDTGFGRIIRHLPRWLARFDADPVIASGDGGPPRIVLSDAARAWRAEVSATRADIYWVLSDATARPPLPHAFYPAAADLLVEVMQVARTRVGRLAAVITRLAAQDAPGPYLAAHYCHPDWSEDPPDRCEVAIHHRYPLGGQHMVNGWTRSRTAPGPDPSVMAAVHVEQDLNTLVEETMTRRFSAAEVSAWFALVPGEMDAMLDRHFPAARAGASAGQ